MASAGPAFSSATPLDQEIPKSEPLSTPDLSLEDSYDIESTCVQVSSGGFKRVALQFPDELLHDAVPVYQALRTRLPIEIELYVLADTTFGSCCVDEVAAEHVNADLMVHYGHACMSPTVRLPCIYVFGKKRLDASDAAYQLAQAAADDLCSRRAAILMYDVAYEWMSDQVAQQLRQLTSIPIILSTVDRSAALLKGKAPDPVRVEGACGCSAAGCCGGLAAAPVENGHQHTSSENALASRRRYGLPQGCSIEKCVVMYIGEESLGLTNFLMTHPSIPIYTYTPSARVARLESSKTNRMLMRRYALTQKARDADVFGIVVGTLGVAAYLPLISHLRAILRKHRRKAYTLAVGKLNPAKLANYQEIECFVLVACGENSFVEGAKDFYRPIVTPFELEVALGERAWTGSDYILDFGQLLSGRPNTDGFHDQVDPDDADAPVFSAVTGRYRTRKQFGDTILDPALGVLAVREGGRAVAEAIGSAAGMHLAERSYQGLEPRFGEDAPSLIEQGRHGIARGYQEDRANSV